MIDKVITIKTKMLVVIQTKEKLMKNIDLIAGMLYIKASLGTKNIRINQLRVTNTVGSR